MTVKTKRMSILLLILLFSFGSTEGGCGTIKTTVRSHTAILSDGTINIEYEIGNNGDDTAYRVTVTTFLALDAQKSDDLGNNPPGGFIHYTCSLHPSSLKPGHYTLVARISFDEQNGSTHKAYHFSSIPYRLEQVGKIQPALSVGLTEPRFNLKSFWQPGSKCILSLKNNLALPIRPVVAFYLPDGFTTKVPERSYPLAPGEKKEAAIPFEMDSSVRSTSPFYVVAWYEENGIHFSQSITGKINFEERPVYFKRFLIFSACVLISLAVFFFLCRQKTNRKRNERNL